MEPSAAERFRRVDAVFDAALDLAATERAAFIAGACVGDTQLIADVQQLLRAHERSDGFLRGSATELAAPLMADDTVDVGDEQPPPDRIGPYRIAREIGRGGMGVVYLAERDDPNFQQRVALKVVRSGLADGRALIARFLAERQLLVSLEHPHIARLFDGGVTTDGLPFYTMAFCEGGSLAERLHAEGALPVAEAIRIARQLATALAAAHARGVVHRDVKPANVLFDGNGSVRLSDFGIAKILGENSTRSGTVLGTVAYLAPEQLRGQAVDRRADLWALGVTLYEMLSGRRPFDAPSYAAVLHRIVEEMPEPLAGIAPAVPPAMDALVTQLLQKDVASRPASADEVIRMLDAIAATPGHAPPTAVHGAPSGRRPLRKRLVIAAVLALLAAGAAYVAWRSVSAAPAPALAGAAIPSVAVLPFVNTGGDRADEPFTDGLTDELIATLGKMDGWRVIARSSVFALKGRDLDARTIGDTLGVDHVLEGSVRRAGDRLRVFAQLVSARDGSVLWSEQYDRDWNDVLAVQQDIAGALARVLHVRLVPGADGTRSTTDAAAHELYLKGRFIMYTRTGPQDLESAARYFEAAIARDSNYASAYSGLADAYASIGHFAFGRPDEALGKARTAARRALALDSTLAEARTSLAHMQCIYEYAWDSCDRELRRAIAQDPSYTYARIVYSLDLQVRGRYEAAFAQLDTAGKVDPLRFGVSAVRGRLYVNSGRPNEAIQALQQAIDLNPEADLAWEQLGHAYLQKRMPVEAITAFRKAALLSGVPDSVQLAYAFAVTGDRATAQRMMRDILASSSQRYVPPFHVAMAYTGLGEVDEAFGWLERGYAERAGFMAGLKVTPAFAPLHGDPRWARLIAKMGLDR